MTGNKIYMGPGIPDNTTTNGNKVRRNEQGHILHIERPNGSWTDYIRDASGEVISFKDSTGACAEFTRDRFGNIITYKDEKYSYEYTRDSAGRELAFMDSEGSWRESTYDFVGRLLSHKTSYGIHIIFTRDEDGNLLTFQLEDKIIPYLTGDVRYGLHYEDGHYVAGCHKFTYKEAVEHWKHRSTEFHPRIQARAIKFLKAIEEHQKTLLPQKENHG
jgi:hypothetical protein